MARERRRRLERGRDLVERDWRRWQAAGSGLSEQGQNPGAAEVSRACVATAATISEK
jgi:hypothetical protein